MALNVNPTRASTHTPAVSPVIYSGASKAAGIGSAGSRIESAAEKTESKGYFATVKDAVTNFFSSVWNCIKSWLCCFCTSKAGDDNGSAVENFADLLAKPSAKKEELKAAWDKIPAAHQNIIKTAIWVVDGKRDHGTTDFGTKVVTEMMDRHMIKNAVDRFVGHQQMKAFLDVVNDSGHSADSIVTAASGLNHKVAGEFYGEIYTAKGSGSSDPHFGSAWFEKNAKDPAVKAAAQKVFDDKYKI